MRSYWSALISIHQMLTLPCPQTMILRNTDKHALFRPEQSAEEELGGIFLLNLK